MNLKSCDYRYKSWKFYFDTKNCLGTKTGTFSKCLEYRHDIYSKEIPPWHTI